MQPKSTSKKSYPITGYPNNNDKKNILLSKEHLVIQISLLFLFWNSHRIPSSIHKRPLYSRAEGGRKRKREERGEPERERLWPRWYMYEAFSCSREPDTGREGIKQTGRQDADGEGGGGRELVWMLAAVWTGPNLVARPFPGFRLHRKCYQTVYIFGLLFTALVTRCLRFWRFRKRREPLFHPSKPGPSNGSLPFSLSLSRSHLLPFPFLFSLSTSIPGRATSFVGG